MNPNPQVQTEMERESPFPFPSVPRPPAASVNGTLSSAKAYQGNYASIGGQAIYTDRPTITYVPMTGEKFLRGLITPIDPKHVFFLRQSGYAADFILGLTVGSLNGVRNRSTTGGAVREAEPPLPPCATAITGSGLTTATGGRNARSRPSCSSSPWPKPAAPRSCR